MTNEELVQDLKQFIIATVGQSEERLRDELGGRADELSEQMTKGFTAVGEAAEGIHTRLGEHDDTLADHGRRIKRLEHRAA